LVIGAFGVMEELVLFRLIAGLQVCFPQHFMIATLLRFIDKRLRIDFAANE
jgi:hypothetical protein